MGSYFAYGANMDRAHMARMAPTARPIGPCQLGSHRLAIGRSGYGTLLPAPGRRVLGLLWELQPADERALDRFEGLAEGFYRKDTVEVEDVSGSTHRAMVYLATDDRPGEAHPSYVAQVEAAARALGLPDDYLREIAQLPTGASEGEDWIPPAARRR